MDWRVQADGTLLSSPGGTLGDGDTFQQVGHHRSSVRKSSYLGSGLSITTVIIVTLHFIIPARGRKVHIPTIVLIIAIDRHGGIRIVGLIKFLITNDDYCALRILDGQG